MLPPLPSRDQPDLLGARRLYAIENTSFSDLPSATNGLANRSFRQASAAVPSWTQTNSSGNQRRRLDIDALDSDEQRRRMQRAVSGIGLTESQGSLIALLNS
jgi:hypothetical protein